MKSSARLNDLHPGDVVGTSGASLLSDLITLGTWGIPRYSLSHVGIVSEHKGRLVLFQSAFRPTEKCIIKGTLFQGTQAQELDSLDRVKGAVWFYHLAKPLRPVERKILDGFLHRTVSIPYDTLGAMRVAGLGFIGWLHPETHNMLYCSEWVAAAYRKIERFDTINTAWNPNALMRECQRRGIHRRPVRYK